MEPAGSPSQGLMAVPQGSYEELAGCTADEAGVVAELLVGCAAEDCCCTAEDLASAELVAIVVVLDAG